LTGERGAFFLGVDVGTGSARAGVFDESGRLLGAATQAIQLFRRQDGFHEATQCVFLRMHDDQLVYSREMSKAHAT